MNGKNLHGRRILSVLLIKLFWAFALIWLSRLAFYLFNVRYFAGISTGELLEVLLWGIRFDLSTLFMINSVFIFLMLVPFRLRYHPYYYKPANIVFYLLPNILALAANFIDTVYYRFTLKRMTAEVFQFISSEETQFLGLIPQFIGKFLPEFLCWLLFSVALIYLSSRIKLGKVKDYRTKAGTIVKQFIILIISASISVVIIRGGFQLKPISLTTAAIHSGAKYIPLVLNTPFSLIKTVGQKGLEEKQFFGQEEVHKIYSPRYLPDSTSTRFLSRNIVLIILESFSAEHIGALNQEKEGFRTFTPFLDSLIKTGTSFNAFANGKRSIEAIPAITASLPTLMQTDFLTSAYAGNRINSLASLLGEKGYHTAFFHGGNNGTMSFDAFASLSGFDEYHGRKEFNDDTHFDGKWGIFDHAFFQYFARQLNQMTQPFMGSFFSLSSHHPYTIPESFKGKFKKGPLEIQESIMYADHSLKKFFETAAQMPWYENTLFVITADHTSESYVAEYSNRIGNYRIPIVFFEPGTKQSGLQNKVAQQTDIMPTILNKLHFDEGFIAFGNDLSDSTSRHFAIQFTAGTYQLVQGNHILIFDGSTSLALYNYVNDPLLRHNLLKKEAEIVSSMERFLKAIIQQYNYSLINNKLTID
ncbi:MAG: sulfatase-like hydrolase/transferase [Bacteroidota bacterium]|nr:sulfatase-like hydrolase/transferase [Bacteroidota bacterium]